MSACPDDSSAPWSPRTGRIASPTDGSIRASSRDLERLGYRGCAAGDRRRCRPGLAGARADRIVDRVGPGRLRVGAADRPRRASARGSRSAGPRPSSSATASTRYLLEAGGDLVARGPSPDGGPWMVGIEDPAGGAEPLAVDRRRGRRRRDLVGPACGRWVRRRPGRAPSHRPADRRTRGWRPARGHGRRARPGLGRGLVEDAVHRRPPRDRARGAGARPGRLVGDRRREPSR